MSSFAPAAPAGWYRDPEAPGQRYWDGVHWTEYRVADPPPPVAASAAQAAAKDRSTMAVVALCFGLAAVLAGGAMYILFWLAWGLGIVAVVLGLIARNGARRTMATWALLLGIGALALGGVGAAKVNKAATELQNAGQQLQNYSNCMSQATTLDQMNACGANSGN